MKEEGQRERETETERQRQRGRDRERQKERKINKRTERLTNGPEKRQSDKGGKSGERGGGGGGGLKHKERKVLESGRGACNGRHWRLAQILGERCWFRIKILCSTF